MRAAGAGSLGGVMGSGGMVVRAVSARFGADFGMLTVSFVMVGSVPVEGSAGGRVRYSMGAISES